MFDHVLVSFDRVCAKSGAFWGCAESGVRFVEVMFDEVQWAEVLRDRVVAVGLVRGRESRVQMGLCS